MKSIATKRQEAAERQAGQGATRERERLWKLGASLEGDQ